MRERMCKNQETLFSTDIKIYVSHCNDNKCDRFLAPVSKKTCLTCPFRSLPDVAESKKWDVIFNSVAAPEFVQERHASKHSFIFDKHCSKCPEYDNETMECGACNCVTPPVDELIRYAHLNCPLEKW